MPIVRTKEGLEKVHIDNLIEIASDGTANAHLSSMDDKLSFLASSAGQAQMLSNQFGQLTQATTTNTKLTELNTSTDLLVSISNALLTREEAPTRVSGLSANVKLIPPNTNEYLPVIDTTGYKKLTITGWGAYGVNDGSVRVALYFDNEDTAFDGGLVAVGTFDGGSLYFGTVDVTSNFAKCRLYNDHPNAGGQTITIKYYLST